MQGFLFLSHNFKLPRNVKSISLALLIKGTTDADFSLCVCVGGAVNGRRKKVGIEIIE